MDPLKDFRIVFMGTPEFAVASLRALHDKGFHVAAVVTAMDKPAGRGQKLQESDVKRCAAELHIPVLQPEKLKDPVFLEQLDSFHADLFVVVAFRMLPEVVWSLPPYGTINLHASLLPQYRGAAPINWAIINGESKTGVTTFFIEKDIDTGYIIDKEEVFITEKDSAGSLHDKLMEVGAQVLVRTVSAIVLGNYSKIPQSGGMNLKAAPKIFKDNCRINWDNDVVTTYNFIRGLSPYPSAWTVFVNIHTDQTFTAKIFETEKENAVHSIPSGTLVSDEKHFLKVAVKDGYLKIQSIQFEGKKRLHIEEFLRGFKDINSYKLLSV